MLNKLLTSLLLIFSLTGLFAENGWSEPKLVSIGDHNQTANIGMDKNGVLHAFWAKADTIPGVHGCIMYAKSGDEGDHWSAPVNVSNNPTDRPIYPNIMFDSQNNIRLVYKYLNGGNVFYQSKTNNQWTTPLEIVDYASSYVNAIIDHNDKIYVFWNIYYNSSSVKSYFKTYENEQWSPKALASDSIGQKGVFCSPDNVIHITGGNQKHNPIIKAYYFNYTNYIFNNITDISGGQLPSIGFDVKYSTSAKLHIPMSVGEYSDTAGTFYTKSHDTYTWSQPKRISTRRFLFTKQVISDSGSNPHLFDQSLEKDTIFRNYKIGDQWQKEVVAKRENDSGINDFIGDYKAIIQDDNIYLIYTYAVYNQTTKIYFKKKKLTVGIEDNYQLSIYNLQLVNYPNPFNNSTKISFNLPFISEVKLEVFNTKGELVQSVFTGQLKSGQHAFSFKATALNSGVYYCRLTTATEVKTTKLMLLK